MEYDFSLLPKFSWAPRYDLPELPGLPGEHPVATSLIISTDSIVGISPGTECDYAPALEMWRAAALAGEPTRSTDSHTV